MAESSGLDLSKLERKVDKLNAELKDGMADLQKNVGNVQETVDGVSKDLLQLKKDFERMVQDQVRRSELQYATTELVRVRQELDQKYGNYRTIRETMIGILQATDAALVKKTTISNVSEELMISTPDYWLAPCLVAVAAWIGNDRDLANRAISEAVRRDEERTSLVMALICRRNNRTETCYEWLSVYFANQNAAHFSEGTFLYVDAYVNGVFGPDTRHLCDDYIQRWLEELQDNNKNFARDQEKVWKDYCQNFIVSADEQFPLLKENVVEYNGINSYMERVNSVEIFTKKIRELNEAKIDQEALKNSIDGKLLDLIQKYNDNEAPLRDQEELFIAIQKFNGDRPRAEQYIQKLKESRRSRAKDLVGQMVEVIKGKDDGDVSQKKTAITFLSPYIERGMDHFAQETKGNFPEKITVSVNGWKGTTVDGSNRDELQQQYRTFNENNRQKELQALQGQKPIGWIVGVVLSLLFCFAFPPLGIVAAVICVIQIVNSGKKRTAKIEKVNNKYDQLGKGGQERIDECVAQWMVARNRVQLFENRNKKIA